MEWATAGGGSGANWPPISLPCGPPDLPERSAQFFSATYGPRNELLTLPLVLDDGTQRTHTRAYDVVGRVKQTKVVNNKPGESNVSRTFDYSYDVLNGQYKRIGPDGPGGANGAQTVVQLDSADRVQYVERRASASPGSTLLMRADYTHYANDLVESVTYARTDTGHVGEPGASVYYTYDVANRVTAIEHRNLTGTVILRLAYTYYNNDLPWTITESGVSGAAMTTFGYDRRNRLTSEYRNGENAYQREYVYDAGGNRTLKIDPILQQETRYHYDLENPQLYGSNNNRLMYEELVSLPTEDVLSTTYYEYSGDGNVTRIITEVPAPGGGGEEQAAMPGGGGEEMPNPAIVPGEGEGGGATELVTPPLAEMLYSALRFGYANNGQAVVFAHGETWTGSYTCPSDYQITWAREFRNDGARARYMNRKLNPTELEYTGSVVDLGTTWSDYDGDEAYGDFTVTNGVATNIASYQPGLWRSLSGVTDYLHSDMLGTLRRTTNTSGAASGSDVFTAFGERLPGSETDRFGYVGAWGYQAATSATPGDPYVTGFPFLHVGARYYDPSSGRFLQRDPIGIRGGLNVYAYANSKPTAGVDPDGLFWDTIWDIGSIGYDLIWGTWEDVGWDVAALALPFVPAGSHKLLKGLKKLSDADIAKLKKAGVNVHKLKGKGKGTDLFKDKDGNIYQGPKDGSGMTCGEATGDNLNDP